ncbi:Tn3 transposase DDE domain-containing protein [Paramaledivibacter caminithermalis DSM 15212]|uniref:Tn3 transposase DDE domain-containing protein n=1 Tax=Paramaledivibacter caminithermalis (strain DSM 15212 / CIP 107654 / DViRD3) TaxID=1121301 RepID=A0A1M6KIT0_PARC5|nr:Tn3 transposase DDE domain-containing protein [Paramaledivibacter caminithermalis DSM 15212]
MYIRRKYINKDDLRNAISDVVNAILDIRAKEIWGETITSCASDSKKFASWDQNLMTEWHIRYRDRGVMIYWHVEKNSTYIYSQLKSCSSSEVSSMIEGLLRHCTDMEIEKTMLTPMAKVKLLLHFAIYLVLN